jgi:hypothetical protein
MHVVAESSQAAQLSLCLLRPFIQQDFPPHHQRQLPGGRVHLKLHLMRLVARPQAEVAGEVAAEELLFLDCGEESLVDCLLVGCAGGGRLLLLGGDC